ncbi:MAG TPA: lasso peptide biosynthesis B2 protein [Steroidobacteraceae bacterium]|nr:lasso peptide biosynthesis B2 protein [Steroidobacteraceae bacterium]
MQPYLLAPHVFPCVSGQHVVLMDLERDKYVAVAPAHRLAGRVRGWPVGAAQASGIHNPERDADELVSQMLAHGMLVSDPQLGKPAVPVTIARPERALVEFDFDVRPRAGGAHLWRFARSCLRAQLSLKLSPMQSIVQTVRERKARAGGPAAMDGRWQGASTADLRLLVAAFTRLRPLFYTLRSACLLDSLTLLHFLGADGICPDWVFGVKTEPFDAHCWVQQGEVLFNDVPDRVRQYSPILVV